MAKISSGNVLDPRRSGALTTEEYAAIAAEVVSKLGSLRRQKWQYGVRISDRRSQGPDLVLRMDTDNPGSIATTFGNTEIEVVNVTMENGMVSKSEDNVASVSEMLQRVATKDPAILGILQQL
jgi:hypothetical protein